MEKKRNPQDSTLRNDRATKKRELVLARAMLKVVQLVAMGQSELVDMERRLTKLERRLGPAARGIR